jgi:hypothetical protein
LFPFDGNVVGLEDGFYGFGYFGADAVTCTEEKLVGVLSLWMGECSVVVVYLESKSLYISPHIL